MPAIAVSGWFLCDTGLKGCRSYGGGRFVRPSRVHPKLFCAEFLIRWNVGKMDCNAHHCRFSKTKYRMLNVKMPVNKIVAEIYRHYTSAQSNPPT